MTTAAYRNVPLQELHESKHNPRRHFDPEALQQLADNMTKAGILTPLLVRAAPNGQGGYEILDGARRFRAARLAKLTDVPVRILDMSDDLALEVIVIANLQRENLHPLEEANGYHALLTSKTWRDAAWIAARVGRSTKYVYDRVKLLSLTKDAQQLFLEGKFSPGHAVILARLKPDEQKRVIGTKDKDYGDGGLFTGERSLFTPEEEFDEDGAGRTTVKPVSVRELQAHVDEHVKFDKAEADPMLFPETVQTVTAAKEQAEKIVQLTHEHYVQPAARDAKERIFSPRSWKRADGTKGNKACDRAVTGVIVVGPGRGEAFRVCVDKKKCAAHWGTERQASQRRATAATTGGRTGEERWKIEERKRQEDQRRRDAESARWKKATPEILTALAAAVKKAPVKSGGLLGQVLVDYCKPDAWDMANRANAADYVARGRTAEDLVRHVAFTILVGEACNHRAPEEFPKRAKAFGLDVRTLVDQVAPAPKAAKPETPAPAKTKPTKKAKRKAA